MINNTTINNFKGINNINIDEFKKINLFYGNNNAGKTSLLQGIYLATLFDNTNNLKDYFENLNLFRKLFNNFDINIENQINIKTKDFSVELNLKPVTGENNFFVTPDGYKKLDEIKLNYIVRDENNEYIINNLIEKIETRQNNKGIIISKDDVNNNKYIIDSKYLGHFYNCKKQTFDLYNDFYEKGAHLQVSEILKELQPNLKEIIPVDNELYCDADMSEVVTIDVMGSGVTKLLSIFTILYQCSSGVAFIDNMECGLGDKALELLWKNIFKISNDLNIQLFITTNSLFFIESYLHDYPELKEQVGVYKIEKSENSICAS